MTVILLILYHLDMKKATAGRPSKAPEDRYVSLTFSLPQDWDDKVRKFAEGRQRSLSEIMRLVVEKGLPLLIKESK